MVATQDNFWRGPIIKYLQDREETTSKVNAFEEPST